MLSQRVAMTNNYEKFYFGKKKTPLDLGFNIYKIGSGRKGTRVVINVKLWAVRSIQKFPLFHKQMICLLCRLASSQIPIFSQKSQTLSKYLYLL